MVKKYISNKRYFLTKKGILARRKGHEKYYEANKEKVKERAKKWYIANYERVKENRNKYFKLVYKHNPKYIYKIIKQNSRVRKRPFNLSQSDFIRWYNKQKRICVYCGIKESYIKTKGFGRLTIDRKNNLLGYIIPNMVLACIICNDVKGKYLSSKEMKIIGKIIKKKWLTLI